MGQSPLKLIKTYLDDSFSCLFKQKGYTKVLYYNETQS